jgi:hypothetical protein
MFSETIPSAPLISPKHSAEFLAVPNVAWLLIVFAPVGQTTTLFPPHFLSGNARPIPGLSCRAELTRGGDMWAGLSQVTRPKDYCSDSKYRNHAGNRLEVDLRSSISLLTRITERRKQTPTAPSQSSMSPPLPSRAWHPTCSHSQSRKESKSQKQ